MHFIPMTPPAQVQTLSGFDYVASDAERRRIYAAHEGDQSLLIVNADSGQILGQVEIGPLHGVAVDPVSGHVFTGDSDRKVSEVDPVAMTVIRTADVDGVVDAIAYDPAMHRVYADEDDGTRMFVVDAVTMKEIAAIPLPGHKPEYLAVDPQTHDVYQNIDNLGEVAVIDANKLAVARTFSTPEITHNHPLQYDPDYHILMIGGKNGVIATYTPDGKAVAKGAVQQGIDQCDYDRGARLLACAGSKKIEVLHLETSGAMTAVADIDVPAGVHTLAFDAKTHNLWMVWAEAKGDFVQGLSFAP